MTTDIRAADGASVHLSSRIARSADAVYAFAVDPTHLPTWASGLGSSGELVDGQWVADSPLGRITVRFVPSNDYGVLDHDVTLPTGEVVRNPMRVIAVDSGPDSGESDESDESEVTFTLRRASGTSDDDFETDAATVAADLVTLKHLVEGDR